MRKLRRPLSIERRWAPGIEPQSVNCKKWPWKIKHWKFFKRTCCGQSSRMMALPMLHFNLVDKAHRLPWLTVIE